jgi:hypothetical protein
MTCTQEEGEPEPDDTFVMILNASHVDVLVTLPQRATDGHWHVEINAAAEDWLGHTTCDLGTPFTSALCSFIRLRGTTPAI